MRFGEGPGVISIGSFHYTSILHSLKTTSGNALKRRTRGRAQSYPVIRPLVTRVLVVITRLTVIHSCIAISGLGAHAFGSWKARNSSYMWLRDALPRDLPEARILTYGYDTRLAKSCNFQTLRAIASSFRASLKNVTSNMSQRRPLIFIAHSLGGLVLKRALVQMAYSKDEDDAFHVKATSDILFFGVPNQGMDTTSLYPMVQGHLNLAFLATLDKNNDHLEDLVAEFIKVFGSSDTRIVSFYETQTSPTAIEGPSGNWTMSGKHAVLVDRHSATSGRSQDENLAINQSHSDMVKFKRMDHEYDTVRRYLKEAARHALEVICKRPKILLAKPSTSRLIEPQEDPSVNVQSSRPTRSVSNLPGANDVTILPFGKNEFSTSAKSPNISRGAVTNKTRPISNLPVPSDETIMPSRTKKFSTSTDSSNDSRKAVIGIPVARRDKVVGLQEHQSVLQVPRTAGFEVKDSNFPLDGALLWAVEDGNEAVVRWLLQEANDKTLNVNAITKDGFTVLHMAARNGSQAIVRLLLDRRADNNISPEGSGSALLHVAAENGHEAIVRLLLGKGADINAKGLDGWTSLHVAVDNLDEAMVRLLLEKGADINAKDFDEWTSLHVAVDNLDEAMIKILLENGSGLHAVTARGSTALHLAASKGDKRIVQLLLEKGANRNARNISGETPLDMARRHRRRSFRKLLERPPRGLLTRFLGISVVNGGQ